MVRLLLWLLDAVAKSPSDRLLITTRLLSTAGALPIHSIITTDDAGQLRIRGKQVDVEQVLALRESALNVLRSPAYQIIREQVLYLAITEGIHKGLTTEQLQFSKSAIWFGEQETNLLKTFAGDSGNLPLSED